MYRPFDLLQWVLECILPAVISVAESRKVNHLSIVFFSMILHGLLMCFIAVLYSLLIQLTELSDEQSL